jgi:leader peptidase (prepilin peptidase)/N-methyltransferase
MSEPLAWPLLLGVLGLVFGSFIATVAIRWPEGRSALKGRSACDGCGKALAWRELVPVFSYLAQRGRCRACGAAISPFHIAVELLGGVIGVVAGIVAPGVEGVAGAVFGWLLLALAALDLRAFWLPNVLTGALAVAGLLTGLAGLAPDLGARLIGGVAGYASLALAAWGYRIARGRDGLGGGDPKLLGAIGLWLGWQVLPLVVLAACVGGLLAVLTMRLGGRALGMQDRMPLGVLLAMAAWAVWVWERIG